MRKFKIGKLSLMAFVTVALVAGCGREQAPSPAFPTVIATFPANGATAVLLNTTVTAGFSTVMAPTTINATTFTLTGPAGVAVVGAVSYSGTTATFTPAASLAANTLYTATITTGAKDPGGNPLAANFVWSFTTGPPTVISTVPANNATGVPVNTVVTATFSEAMNAATINGATFTLAGPGATAVTGLVTYAGATATFTPSAVLAANTLYTATITTGAMDPAGVPLAANFVWTFTTAPPPTVVSTVPAAGATAVPVNTLVSATFSEAMNPATITGTTFTVTGPGATAVAGVVTFTGSTATFTPTTALPNSTLFTATITTGAKDNAGAPLAANFVWTFTTIAAAPTVISTIPANGAVGVALGTTVSATFSEAMDTTTLTASTFSLTGPGTTPVTGTVTASGNTATFTPAAALTSNTLYTATITTAAKNTQGTALAANFVWTFNTTFTPAVTSTAPANGASNVPGNQKISATFNTTMNATTITAAGTFAVAVAGGGAAVPGTVTYDSASKTAIFAPSSPLAASTQYAATITTAAQSVQGNALAANYIWSFTTGLTANSTAPTVISTDPADTATAVPLNQRIAAVFSVPMNPSTISAVGTFTVAVAGGGAAVTGTVSYAGRTAVFTPAANLAASTQYTATITTAATDLTGGPMAANFVWNFTTGTTINAVAPTITSTSPADAAVAVPIDKTISATFSTAMNPTTITNATFSLAVAGGGAQVSGTVVYDAATHIATFTPSANFAANAQFTATISNLVTDLSGNSLVTGTTPNPWSFTTSAVAGPGPATINLGTAASFAVLATASTSSTGATVINGDVGLSPGSSQGILPSEVNGTIHVNDVVVTQAQADLLAAYNDAVSRSANAQSLPGNLGGLTLAPGLWVNSTSVLISGSGPGNNVTLDAQGDPNAVFIFKMGSTLTTGPGAQVILAGGAKAGNIFWQVGSSATIDTTSIFKGNILAAISVTLKTGAVAEGRLFAGATGDPTGAVVLDGNTITVPAP